MFHPVVRAWFERRFTSPSPVQELAFPVLASGRDALLLAPTGSGKTLAAFLSSLDWLLRRALECALEDAVHVLYVSPLKALSNDVQKNLEEPCAELFALFRDRGFRAAPLRIGVRTGDTQGSERRRAARKPPHVLVTTPESLFILLASESGRRALEQVRTVILDEIHALAGNKRGAHLSVSVERLEDLIVRRGRPRPQRVGLSATVRPVEVAARLLVGQGLPLPTVVDVGQARALDLKVEIPRDELGAVCTNEQWDELYDRVADLVREHRSTLVFVNTRRLVERLALHLGERLGASAVAAHHGSLSRALRLSAEQRLKAGELRVIVATASLELGIDVGTVDLVCLVGSPRSISVAAQRVGRSGHVLSATPKGRFFPLTRDQLVECAAIASALGRGIVEAISLRKAPLDILAQQVAAIASAEERHEDEVFDLVRRAEAFANLPRESFDQVVSMLAHGAARRRGSYGALLHRDGTNGVLRGRRGAKLVVLTSGGAIPDAALYDVVEFPTGEKIGTLEEDYAVESMAGDVFLLGNTSWRILRTEKGKVWVENARGAPPNLPFWLGEAPARTAELSWEVGALREEVASRVAAGEMEELVIAWLMRSSALDEGGARLLLAYVMAARRSLGAVPSITTIVVERFFDEAGGMQLVVHAPFGGRINRALGLLLRKRFCRSFDFELQAAATDDGVLLSLGPQHSFPLEGVLDLAHPDGLTDVLEQAALQAPMFRTRFRWNAIRSLVLPRVIGGRRVPPSLQRMRSDELLAAIFPAQTACQDNHGLFAPIEPPSHPLVDEALRDCLTEVMDAEGLAEVLSRLHEGRIRFVAVETTEPSVMCHEILNANPYAFLDDAPLEERRARAVSLRRGLPAAIAGGIGALDPQAVAQAIEEATPRVRTADELCGMLVDRIALPESTALQNGQLPLFQSLVSAGRGARLVVKGTLVLWVLVETVRDALAIWPHASVDPPLPDFVGQGGRDRKEATVDVLGADLASLGPCTTAELGARWGLREDDIATALGQLEAEGSVLRGVFRATAASGVTEWCDRRLLMRIHALSLDRRRRAIEPATVVEWTRFLLCYQGLRGARHRGQAGLLRIIEQLQGLELPAAAWESDVLPARIPGYDPTWLDALCLSGEVVWGRFSRPLSPRTTAARAPTRAALITLARRRDLGFLLPKLPSPGAEGESSSCIEGVLERKGALFFDELVLETGMRPEEILDGLWELVGAGRVTGDGFAGMRALIARKGRADAVRAAGRFSLLRGPVLDETHTLTAKAEQYLRRYGVVFREILANETAAPAWRELLPLYRTWELGGRIHGGRFVAGFVGEQFALPEALAALRGVRREPRKGEIVRVAACDPAGIAAVLSRGPKARKSPHDHITFRDGELMDQEARGLTLAGLTS